MNPNPELFQIDTKSEIPTTVLPKSHDLTKFREKCANPTSVCEYLNQISKSKNTTTKISENSTTKIAESDDPPNH